MNKETAMAVDAMRLRTAGRTPAIPFFVMLADGNNVRVTRLLRVLPGKRIVGEGEWQGRRVLAKLFVAKASARHWAQERDGIEALCRANLSTPELLLSQSLPDGGHILLTAFLDGTQSLAESWAAVSERPAGDANALDVLRPAFKILGRLHASGLIQEDLHLGNFLRQDETVFVIDGDAVRVISLGKPLDGKRASCNLAILLAQLPPAWDSCQEALIQGYLSGGGCAILDMAALDRERVRIRHWRLMDFLRKTVRDCTLFVVRRSVFQFVAVKREEFEHFSPLLASMDETIRQGTLLKDGRTCTVAQIRLGERSLVVKRYNLKNCWHALERLWRPSRAWHSWRAGHCLRFLGIPTPEPLALLEERVGPLRRRAFLISAYCPGMDLSKQLASAEEPQREVAEAIIALFRALCEQRISHGDLKATNLFWHEGRVFMIDLDAMIQHHSASSFLRAWRRDRARLLRNWPVKSVLYQWLETNLPPARKDE